MLRVKGQSRDPRLRMNTFACLTDINARAMETYRVIKISHYHSGMEYYNSFEGIPMMRTPADFDENAFPHSEQQPAIVKDNNDPLGMGRVRVQFLWQAKRNEMTPWIRVVQPYTGGGKGFYFVPEIGEEVLVDFEGGNAERPFVLGAHYNGEAKSGYHNADNRIKAIHTKSGHKLIFTEDISQLISYINIGSIFHNLINIRIFPYKNNSIYKIKNIYIYSHGMPSRITFSLDWETYKVNHNIQSDEKSSATELNLTNYMNLNPESFLDGASIWSYACRTGLSSENNSDIEIFTWGEEESLAQKMADFLNINIYAFLKRSSYEDTWGSKLDRLSLKIFDDEFRNYKKEEKEIDNKFIWQPQGAYRDVKAGDTPYGPPNCLCLFRKENSIAPTCETMHFPLG